MAKRGGKKKSQGELGGIVDLAHTINDTFAALTGKTVPEWFEEFRQRPRELPPGETPAASEPSMPLSDAYMVLGLKGEAPLEEVKKRYRNLSNLFHPDRPGGYEEAMKLLNRAYEAITRKEKREG